MFKRGDDAKQIAQIRYDPHPKKPAPCMAKQREGKTIENG